MTISRFAAAAIIAITGLFVAVTGAIAYEAAATGALNVRSGPGTNYRVIGTLSRNQVVEVTECNPSNTWCHVTAANVRGWASARYLRTLGPTTPSRPVPVPVPDAGFSINTPNFSFSFGTGRPADGRICFFEGYDYRGRSFCADGNDNARRIDNFWNDRIRSARVEGEVSATVCTGTNFTGRCGVIDRSIRNLGMLSDDISSYYLGRR